MRAPNCLKTPHASPKLHPLRVKLQTREKSGNKENNNNSLFFFLSFTPTPSRDARPRIYACVCEGVGERVNLRHGHAGAYLGVAARVRTVGHVLPHVASVVSP